MTTYERMAALVRLGLVEFWSRALPDEGGLVALLRQEAATLGIGADQPWETVRGQFETDWPFTQGPLGSLIQDYKLSLPETVIVTLAGEVESSHLLNLVLSDLQAPARSPRPSVHLSIALVEALFGGADLTALDLSHSALLRDGILLLSGDGPIPLRTLGMPAPLWSIFRERPVLWPGCRAFGDDDPTLLPQKARAEVPKLAAMLQRAGGEPQRSPTGVLLRGHPNSGRSVFARALARSLGLEAISAPAEVWRDQPQFAAACRYAGWLPVIRPQIGPGEVWTLAAAGRTPAAVAVILGTDGALDSATILEYELPVPGEKERLPLWKAHLNNEALARKAAASAMLSGPSIVRVARNARLLAEREGEKLSEKHVGEARRYLSAARLRLLAQPVHRRIGRSALVVPELVEQALHNLILRARRRESLWKGLGATLEATPNSGVRALFVGESGTGKTLAASYVATALNAPLYRVDLSVVMNKYIGESEKNLSQLLDHAAASDVVLLFDEADSLFGSRTEGRETGERYANMLTNFLLTRIENHPGIVILTTNSRERIDDAFNRRLDVIVEFPLPGYEQRLDLWRSHLGSRGPGEASYRALAGYCDLAGGQLRNAVIAAAVASGQEPISELRLLECVRSEYLKLGRGLPPKLEQLRIARTG